MSDWSAEVEARLEEDIANLPSISEHAADIRAMLEEIRRLRKETPTAAQEVWRAEASRQSRRAEAAEVEARLEQQFELGGFDTQQMDDDIRAALEEIKRWRVHSERQSGVIRDLTTRAEAAEAAIVAALDESTATKVLKLRIEELKARVEELEGDRNYAYRAKHELEAKLADAEADRGANWERANSLAAENRALKAEVERLREALGSIKALSSGWDEDGPTEPAHGISWAIWEVARAALRGGGE